MLADVGLEFRRQVAFPHPRLCDSSDVPTPARGQAPGLAQSFDLLGVFLDSQGGGRAGYRDPLEAAAGRRSAASLAGHLAGLFPKTVDESFRSPVGVVADRGRPT